MNKESNNLIFVHNVLSRAKKLGFDDIKIQLRMSGYYFGRVNYHLKANVYSEKALDFYANFKHNEHQNLLNGIKNERPDEETGDKLFIVNANIPSINSMTLENCKNISEFDKTIEIYSKFLRYLDHNVEIIHNDDFLSDKIKEDQKYEHREYQDELNKKNHKYLLVLRGDYIKDMNDKTCRINRLEERIKDKIFHKDENGKKKLVIKDSDINSILIDLRNIRKLINKEVIK